ncbi:hypothetical protein NX722_25410 [Endozoicomonas gorgoniicola]|uniref:Uncharacterized protein n=1 Tax=Endozoicomonas gorgoniicola TaxID=1234144 RepID=A0ABT3N2Q9_9GAMM|nr:hypothetical protein [Endozoicomonas gorgoniicola]MCW7555906.1 hypothetical protein [Endozoicomonas gorgoniicola]
MNKNQRESLSKMWFDLVKVPLALCVLGPLVTGVDQLFEIEIFGLSLVILFTYMGYITGEKL